MVAEASEDEDRLNNPNRECFRSGAGECRRTLAQPFGDDCSEPTLSYRICADMMSGMDRFALRMLFLLWLGWYLSGPLFEMIDSWDTPQEEMSDVGWSASGAVSFIAAGVCIGIFTCRKLRELCSFLPSSRSTLQPLPSLHFEFPTVVLPKLTPPNLDDSSLLRI